MAKSDNIPAPAVRRLSFYLRQLEAFGEDNRRTVSSRELGEALGLSDAQVRKDPRLFRAIRPSGNRVSRSGIDPAGTAYPRHRPHLARAACWGG